jgi:hypothetical protein
MCNLSVSHLKIYKHSLGLELCPSLSFQSRIEPYISVREYLEKGNRIHETGRFEYFPIYLQM